MKTTSKLLILVITFLALAASAYAQSPREQLNQMVQQLQKTPNDNALREKIIKLATSIKPTPAIPEEAREPFVMGATVLRKASDPAGASKAVDLFTQALNVAPWFADAYYNRAIAREAAGQFEPAIDDLKLYLEFKLTVNERREAQDKIYSLKADAQLGAAKKAEQDKIASAENAKRQAQKNLIATLKAEYERLKAFADGRNFDNYFTCVYCTRQMSEGSNWDRPGFRFFLTAAVTLHEDADPRVELSFAQTGDERKYNGVNYVLIGRPAEGGEALRWTFKSRSWGAGDAHWWGKESPSWLYLGSAGMRWCGTFGGSECERIPLGASDPWTSTDSSKTYVIYSVERR